MFLKSMLTLLFVSFSCSSVLPNANPIKENDKFDIPYEVYKKAGIPLELQKHLHDQKIENEFMESYLNAPKGIQEDARINVPQLISKYGYPSEIHHVTTVDGYILCMHRIPYGRTGPSANRRPFFLQHGLLSSSADWLITGPENGLGYILADKGYDVWMGNFRGNKYSRNHTYLDPDRNGDFWKFSWHQMGIRDLPTMIDYVLKETKQEKLFHVGHSQGTTTFYVMTSELPEYNDKILAHMSLAPIAYMNHMTSPLMKMMAFFNGPIGGLLNIIGVNEFMPSNGFFEWVGNRFCQDHHLSQGLCTNSLFLVCGFNPDQVNTTLLPVIMGHTPAGSSVDQFMHYSQLIKSGYFRQWDYGFLTNLRKYGRTSPPDYKLNQVKAPVYLIYSKNDWLAAEKDVDRLYRALGNARGKFLVTDEKFNHLDYQFGIDAPKYVYSKVISFASRH